MNPAPLGDAALRSRLHYRIAIAVVILAGLLGGLAIFDAVDSPPPSPSKRTVAMPPAPALSRQAKEPASAGPSTDNPVAAVEKSSPAVMTVTESVPEHGALPDAASLHPAETSPPAPPRATSASELRPSSRSPSTPGDIRRVTEHQLVPGRPNAADGRVVGLQVGVFGKIANAVELRAKLEKAGIPATIEARVYAGPFASREEADAARVRLKDLGMADSLLVTMKKSSPP